MCVWGGGGGGAGTRTNVAGGELVYLFVGGSSGSGDEGDEGDGNQCMLFTSIKYTRLESENAGAWSLTSDTLTMTVATSQ
jgi:hypothetical protein